MQEKNDAKDSVSRSWFCVFNHPSEHGYAGTPEEILDRLRDEWINEHPTRTGAWVYCVSADGNHHVHMVLEDEKPMRFRAIKDSYAPGMHFEATKGTKQQAEDYIYKRGSFEEKGEQILARIQHGEIKGRQGKRRDLEVIQELLEAGKTPPEIMNISLRYRIYEKQIVSHFRALRISSVPFQRDVKVVWHVGESGSGKSYVARQIREERGDSSLYFMTDYDNGCFDNYMCEPVLFMDEYRGQFPYSRLLTLLDVYVHEEHARFSNVSTVWNEVHITSVKAPEMIYAVNVQDSFERTVDTFEQLRRRIHTVVYHWKDEKGFHQYSLPMSNYRDYADLVFQAARSGNDTFAPLPQGVESPFQCKLDI